MRVAADRAVPQLAKRRRLTHGSTLGDGRSAIASRLGTAPAHTGSYGDAVGLELAVQAGT